MNQRCPAVAHHDSQWRMAMALAIAVAGCTASPPASLPEPTGPVTLVVDTDAAPDDLIAIAFLMGAPQVEVSAITVSGTGEAHCHAGVSVVLRLLERLDAPDIPVACGREEPLAGDHAFPELFRQNADQAAGLELPTTTREAADGDAVSLIGETLAGAESPIRVLTLGPLTNLADALEADPELAADIESVYIMGGAVDVPGNVAGSPDAPADNTSAEWNLYVDPTAAAIVFDAGLPIYLVSLDGTNQIPITPTFVQQVEDRVQGAGLEVLAELFERNSYMTEGSYYLWDATAAISAAGYPIGEYTLARLQVDTGEGPTSGATQLVDGEPNARYLSSAQATVVEGLMLQVLNAE